MRGHAFLEKIQAAKAAAEAATSEAAAETPRSAEEMSDEELEEAITASKRELLDAQHAELREREIARVSPSESSPEASLADLLRAKQRGKRRTWR
jgi:hypothetical protein